MTKHTERIKIEADEDIDLGWMLNNLIKKHDVSEFKFTVKLLEIYREPIPFELYDIFFEFEREE